MIEKTLRLANAGHGMQFESLQITYRAGRSRIIQLIKDVTFQTHPEQGYPCNWRGFSAIQHQGISLTQLTCRLAQGSGWL